VVHAPTAQGFFWSFLRVQKNHPAELESKSHEGKDGLKSAFLKKKATFALGEKNHENYL
jgi:hypothetical protein